RSTLLPYTTLFRSGDQEGVLAAHQVADASEQQRAERPHQEAGGVGGERREQRGGLVARREEQRGEERRQHCVEIEVVPLEYGTQRGRENYALLSGAEVVLRGACGHGLPLLYEAAGTIARCALRHYSGKPA